MQTNVLILGSEGFIGSHLVAKLLNNEYSIVGCDIIKSTKKSYLYYNLSILSDGFDSLFTNNKFDFCINASGSGSVSFSIDNPIDDFKSNTLTVAKVLDTIRTHQPSCKFLHISSAAVYGNPTCLPIIENFDAQPLSPYGYHKLMSELLCKEYFSIFKVSSVIIRPFSVYGNGLRKQLLWDICEKLSKSEVISLFGTGNETRDFIHIDDLTECILLIIENSLFENEIYNVATGNEISIRQIKSIFESSFQPKKFIKFSGQEKKGDPINWRADITKLEKLGFKPTVNLQDGITNYINWYLNL